VPCAITGTEKIFRGGFPVPRRVQVAFSPPVSVSELAPSQEAASELIEEMVWPEVDGSYRRLRARPTLIAAGLAALGVGGGLLARRRRRRRRTAAAKETGSSATEGASGVDRAIRG
jgi:1-acyl-sn-glycerol-3-phosphate acyltransferase